MNAELYASRNGARERFLAFSTVLGVGVGPKLSRGRVTAGDAIVVLVGRKLPQREVPQGELIPPTFDGFPTDVREPVLTVKPQEGEKGRPRRSPEWCLTDAQWIDWPKIHELNQAQQQRIPPPSRPRTPRRPRGSSND